MAEGSTDLTSPPTQGSECLGFMTYCLKVSDDEQSVMKSGRLFQARGPATANARSPMMVAAAGQMKMMTAVLTS